MWASKYNERALLSMKKVGLDFNDLRMAVLVQRVVPAEYAYVIHTHNPSNGSPEEIYAEVVKGLGESIVSGMVPGSSLSFMAKKSDIENPEVTFLACCKTHVAGGVEGGGGWNCVAGILCVPHDQDYDVAISLLGEHFLVGRLCFDVEGTGRGGGGGLCKAGKRSGP